MRRGEVRALTNHRETMLLLSDELIVDGEPMVRAAPLRLAEDTLHTESDLLLTADRCPTGVASYVEFWNERPLPIRMLGESVGEISPEVRMWIAEIRRCDVMGEVPNVPAGLLGPASDDPRIGEQDLARLAAVDAAIADLEHEGA